MLKLLWPSSVIHYTSEVNIICLGWNASTSSCCFNQTLSTSCMWSLHFWGGSKKRSNKIILLHYIKPNPPDTGSLRKLCCVCSWLQREKDSPISPLRSVDLHTQHKRKIFLLVLSSFSFPNSYPSTKSKDKRFAIHNFTLVRSIYHHPRCSFWAVALFQKRTTQCIKEKKRIYLTRNLKLPVDPKYPYPFHGLLLVLSFALQQQLLLSPTL